MDVQRVVLPLFRQPLLTLCEGRTEEGVAVGSKDNLMGLEVEGDDGDVLFGNGETVDDGVGDVLPFHAVDDVGEDIVTRRVMGAQFLNGHPPG